MAILRHLSGGHETEPYRHLIVPPKAIEEADFVFQIENRPFNTGFISAISY
jgi:hypothetical protein